MKKLFILFSFFCFSGIAFATPQASLSEVLQWNYGSCFGTRQADEKDMSPNPKMVIWYWKCEAEQPSEQEIEAMIQEYTGSQEYYAQRFDVTKFTHELGLAFTGVDAVLLSPYLGAYQSYAEAKNFLGIKDFTDGLVALGKATQEQANEISDIFANQGIILSEWE